MIGLEPEDGYWFGRGAPHNETFQIMQEVAIVFDEKVEGTTRGCAAGAALALPEFDVDPAAFGCNSRAARACAIVLTPQMIDAIRASSSGSQVCKNKIK